MGVEAQTMVRKLKTLTRPASADEPFDTGNAFRWDYPTGALVSIAFGTRSAFRGTIELQRRVWRLGAFVAMCR